MKYIWYSILTLFCVFIGFGVYEQLNKAPISKQRIPCHKATFTFEKVFDRSKIKPFQHSLENGSYTLKVKTWRSKYMPSKLFKYVSAKSATRDFNSLFCKQNSSDKFTIKLFINENDKQDPRKKLEESKRYEGFLYFRVLYEQKTIYKVQFYFYKDKGEDIFEQLQCFKNSALSL